LTRLLETGGLVESQVGHAMAALDTVDAALVEQVKEGERRLNAMEVAIDEGFGRFDCVDGSEQMLESEFVFPVCSPDFAARYRLDDLRNVDLNQIPLLHMDTRDVRWLDWEQWCRLTGVTASSQPPRIRYNNYPLMLNAVVEGHGLALGWSTLVRQWVQEGKLVDLDPSIRRSNFGYILHSRYPDNAIVDPIRLWLLKHVTEYIPAES
jgi:DNA-binding transcriptional LysR family regulator